MLALNKIYCGDNAQLMKQIDSESVDLTVTSPPYDQLRNYNGYAWNFAEVAKELFRITKPGGVVVWVVGDATIDGDESGTSFRQALYFKEIGFRLHDTMIWRKTNPMPKVKTSRYFDVFEYMFVFSKGRPKTFNPIMQKCKLGGELYDSTTRVADTDHERVKKAFILNEERYRDNIWNIAIAQNKTEHPAVFPEQLAEDHILTWSNEGDVVLDPFMGSGTVGRMAARNRRSYLGIDISEEYCAIAREQIRYCSYKSFADI